MVKCLNPWDNQTKRIYETDGQYCTLQANSGGVDGWMGFSSVWPTVARTLAARADSSPCIDRGMNIVVIKHEQR